MSESGLVLDNSILSALFTSGWFDAPSFYRPDQPVLISDRVWNGEFTPYHDVESTPAWATVRRVDLEAIQTQALGQLSKPDWSCIAVAEQVESDPAIVTNDRALREVALRRDLNAEWGTHFIIRTFKACGITVSDFAEGIDTYLADVTLPAEVATEVRNTEK